MRRYELMLLLRPDLEDDKLQAAVERVTRAIVNGGGSLSKVSPWGRRRLAYDIGRHREASYFLIHFDIEPGQVREIERGMLISEEILRHLVTVIEDRGPVEEIAPAVAARTPEGQPSASASDESAGETATSSEPMDDTEASAPADTTDEEGGAAADEAIEDEAPAAQDAATEDERPLNEARSDEEVPA